MADKEFKQLLELVDKVVPPNDIFAQPIPIEHHSTHYPYVPTHLQKVGAKVTGQQGEERFQFWPERMVRSAFSLPVDMYYGNTDEKPVKWEPNWLGEKLGLKGVVEAPGSGSALARSFDAAGLGMTGVLGPAKAGIVGSGIRPKAIKMPVEEFPTTVYHGTPEAGFSKFQTPEPAQYMPDRALGTHVAKDPEVANTFMMREGDEGGGGYKLSIPDDSKFLVVDQPLLPYVEKGTPKNYKNVISDQSAIEKLIYTTVYKKDPEMLARYLVEARGVKDADEALKLATDMANGKTVDLPVDGKGWTLDRFINNFNGKPYNKADRQKSVEAFLKEMKDQGYIGIKYINTAPNEMMNAKDPTSYIVFDPSKHIKNQYSGMLMSDTSIPGVGIVAGKEIAKAPMFYSAIEKALSSSKQNTASAEQWLGYLKNQPGVKAEELATLKLDELPKGQLTKAQIEEFIKANKPELVENWKGENVYPNKFAAHDWFRPIINEIKTIEDVGLARKHNPNFKETFKDVDDKTLLDQINEYKKLPNFDFSGPSKYSKYQLPGGENYRELVVSLPKSNSLKIDSLTKEINSLSESVHKKGGEWSKEETLRYQELTDQKDKLLKEQENPYVSTHWDEINPLYHVRMNDRMIDGKKSLHIEEIQSDWHQAGRKQGYKGEEARLTPAELEESQILSGRQMSGETLSATERARFDELQKKHHRSLSDVPNAPFKKSWDELAFKRAIREAVENGYDQISWTPGEAQAARYDLSKQVSKIELTFADKNDKGGSLSVIDKDGNNIVTKVLDNAEKELPDIIGKEATKKLLERESKSTKSGLFESKILEDDNLRIGGEGMKGFYDKMLVDKANALAKKYGVKVERKEINKKYRYDDNRDKYIDEDGNEYKSVDEAKQPVWSLKLTPEMKKDVMEKGFPLFSSGFPTLTPVDIDPFKPKVKLTPVDFDPFAPDKV